jgi:sterol desaturase/sphingolipid hydroxylase (fatty acid hydroxylase superfamily)
MVNITLFTVTIFDCLITNGLRSDNQITNLSTSFLASLTINNFFLHIVENFTKDKNYIRDKDRKLILEKNRTEFNMYLISSTIIESSTNVLLNNYFVNSSGGLFSFHIVYFVPISFIFELLFDFFHYWSHRTLHQNKYLYQVLHKHHHRFSNPIPIITFYQHPVDLLLTNSIPSFLSFFIINKLCKIQISQLLFKLIMNYKSFIEISGHCGKETKTSSFPQFIWLPRYFNIELYTIDHDLHHSSNNCNYSKRFSAWDKCFGTYSIS